MKLNTFFLMSATAMAMASATANAADEAVADAVWSGVIGDSIPSSNLVITGLNSGEIQPGTLHVKTDGTFTSSQVTLEARDYDSETQVVGDRQPDATWTYVSSQVLMGNQVTQDASLTVKDENSQQEFTQGSAGQVTGGYVKLSVANDKVISDVPVEGEAQVIVQMAASYIEAL
ncbi:hypothetical protein D0812_11585 [Vibrio owensii]|uniref:Uncharacterized protein n=2 Tax=Vibrio harveyi group TaxID=717610 RepID=A0AAP9GBL9_9VIBR|nr:MULTISPECIES: hypothetical protein [Vibrio harveyi group]AYO15021.1 hypothetical protein D0812_11585 [Vibrio owensii]EKO3858709.1 hypothetical protein [Vibrio harveyi]QGH47308.1 hypothetical protein APZ19_09500 [Vibrio owensii]RIW05318.1 hypothetical protein DS957_022880 [Vibrio harveyi]